MKFVVPVIIIVLFAYFTITGMRNLQATKMASASSTPTKNYLSVSGGVQVAMAATILFIAIYTFRKYGDLDYFFRVIHGFLNPQ
ncbi:MAG: hypothetical protein PHG66_04405 [Candidatus Colwellbacteria bacterium]|nr:hypothetical protein [Candidatus Colwellbacteria bacterium]